MFLSLPSRSSNRQTGAARPDAIIHCAAMTAVDICETERDRAFLVNALGVRFVMEGARRAGAYLVRNGSR